MARDNRQIFDEMYDQWKGHIYRYLVHYVGSVSDVEDLFQEVWLKAYSQCDHLRDSQRARAWIFRIARNCAFDHLRKNRRKTQVWVLSDLAMSPQDENAILEGIAAPGASPTEVSVERERQRIVHKVLKQLDPVSQEVFQMHFFESLVLEEIAEILDIPLGTVRTKIFRGLRTIRQILHKSGYRALDEI